MKKLFSTIVATVAVVAAAQNPADAARAQLAARNGNASSQMTQTTLKVDDKNYTVTEMAGGRSGHMVSLAGPDGTAMVSVNDKNEIVAYISPAGGIAPNGSDYKPLINQVWAAYLDQKSQVAAPIVATNEPAPNAPSTTTPPNQPVVKSLSDASVVVFDPKLGTDVTFTENGMKASWTVTPKVPGGVPMAVQSANYTAFFEGGDEPAGAGKKVGKSLAGGTIATLQSMNTSAGAVSGIGANPDKVWKVEAEIGKNKRNVYESGEYRIGEFKADTGKDPAAKQGISILVAIRQDWEVAQEAIVAAQKEGKAKGFDLSTDRVKRGQTALQDATKGYNYN